MADLKRKERCKRLATLRKQAERDREYINKKNATKVKNKEKKKRQRLNESNLQNTQMLRRSERLRDMRERAKQRCDEELPEQKYVQW